MTKTPPGRGCTVNEIRLSLSLDADSSSFQWTLDAKLHITIGSCKERVIATTSNIRPRVKLRTPLTYDDVSGLDELTVAALYAPILRV